jgi:hypothetical protein
LTEILVDADGFDGAFGPSIALCLTTHGGSPIVALDIKL